MGLKERQMRAVNEKGDKFEAELREKLGKIKKSEDKKMYLVKMKLKLEKDLKEIHRGNQFNKDLVNERISRVNKLDSEIKF